MEPPSAVRMEILPAIAALDCRFVSLPGHARNVQRVLPFVLLPLLPVGKDIQALQTLHWVFHIVLVLLAHQVLLVLVIVGKHHLADFAHDGPIVEDEVLFPGLTDIRTLGRRRIGRPRWLVVVVVVLRRRFLHRGELGVVVTHMLVMSGICLFDLLLRPASCRVLLIVPLVVLPVDKLEFFHFLQSLIIHVGLLGNFLAIGHRQ